MGGIVTSQHIVVKVGGALVADEVIKPANGSTVGFPRPWERRLTPESNPDGEITVDVETLGPNGAKNGPHLTRHASTHFMPGKTALFRVGLESRCVVYPQLARGHGALPGVRSRYVQ